MKMRKRKLKFIRRFFQPPFLWHGALLVCDMPYDYAMFKPIWKCRK